jgi:Flavin-binding monooxygenase-like
MERLRLGSDTVERFDACVPNPYLRHRDAVAPQYADLRWRRFLHRANHAFANVQKRRANEGQASVGAGNSGVDIACDAARFAAAARISVRRGYHLIPKHVFGQPADVFASTGPHLPNAVAQRVLPLLLKVVMGDPTKHGWPKPDHKILESHPIVNDQILHHLRHGDLEVRSDIARFDGADVLFTDGKRECFDLVICATGYKTKVPYLPESVFDWKGDRPNLFLRVFSRSQDGLSCLGFTEGDGGAYELFDNMADMIARTAWAATHDPTLYARLRNRFAGPDIDLTGGTRYLASDRHCAYVNLHAWQKAQKSFRKEFGWPPITPTMFDKLRVEQVA